MKRSLTALLAVVLTLSLAACAEKKPEPTAEAFTPALDTQQTATLEIAGFMGNFEALDQVINAFSDYYPNVTFTYDHNSAYMLSEYLTNNKNTDLFMTCDQNLRQPDPPEHFVQDRCLGLSDAGLALSALSPEAVAACTVDGKLLRLPIAMNAYGVVVNKTLLDKEGLSVPTNYEEFLSVLAAIKDKGYTPLQGSAQHLYGDLTVSMGMDPLLQNSTLLAALYAGEDAAAAAVLPAFERLETLIAAGYTDYALNCTYPTDNYDGSIMAFFEGDVPFYVCNAECVSGMKKRESKSETFHAAPFEYEFLYALLGDSGAYAYLEPWYGFSVSKDSDEAELAVEFLRFMSTRLDEMAGIKGLPSVAADSADERYAGIRHTDAAELSFTNDGRITETVRNAFQQVCGDLVAGVYATAGEAARAFVQQCAG